jgi:hypothetical protein
VNGGLRTLAHELGHGIFGLQHPFTNYNTTVATDLLMDYGTGTALSHNDWEIMHAPGLQLYQFTQGSGAGELFFSILSETSKYNTFDYEFDDLDANAYFNGGKLDITGGGDRIVVKDKTGRVTDLFTSPNYDPVTWKKIKQRFWVYTQSKSTESYKWTSGYESYTLGEVGKNNYFYGSIGTLTIINTGKFLSLSFDNFQLNMLGSIYIGPKNPKKHSSPGFNGDKDDYSREPQDLADAAARAHDWGYDNAKTSGVNGAIIETNNREVDIHLVRGARKIMYMYNKQMIDRFTKNSISKETFVRAKKIDQLFTLLATRKITGNNPFPNLSIEDEKLCNKMKDIINLSIDDMLLPVDTYGKKFTPVIK